MMYFSLLLVLLYKVSIGEAQCKGKCGKYSGAGCWCDTLCVGYNDCCSDYYSQCSCDNKCGKKAGGCWCDTACVSFGDCCDDYKPECSCEGICGGKTSQGNCYCDDICHWFKDCCNDKLAKCGPPNPGSCYAACGYQSGNCWCDSLCKWYGDCCYDFNSWCPQYAKSEEGKLDEQQIAAGRPEAKADSARVRPDSAKIAIPAIKIEQRPDTFGARQGRENSAKEERPNSARNERPNSARNERPNSARNEYQTNNNNEVFNELYKLEKIWIYFGILFTVIAVVYLVNIMVNSCRKGSSKQYSKLDTVGTTTDFKE